MDYIRLFVCVCSPTVCDHTMEKYQLPPCCVYVCFPNNCVINDDKFLVTGQKTYLCRIDGQPTCSLEETL